VGDGAAASEATILNLSAGKTHFSNVTVDLVFKSHAAKSEHFLVGTYMPRHSLHQRQSALCVSFLIHDLAFSFA
jgi:hypothetical protein